MLFRSTLLRALGYGSDEQILRLFYDFKTLETGRKWTDDELRSLVMKEDKVDTDSQAVIARRYDPCTLMMFLLNVHPKRWFTGKKVLILRFAVIIPIAYEGFCFWLKIQAMRGKVMLPMWSYPLLTMKPPIMILLFIVMAFVVKIREYRYCKHGNTHEDYQAFMQTNRNSFHLSVRLAILMVIFAVLDFVLLVLLTYLNADSAGALNATGEMAEEASDTFISLSLAVGIGKSWPIVLLAPFMLLFSYNKEPKNKMISMVLPAVAIVLCIFIVLEATRMGVGMIMNGKQINVDEVGQMLQSLVGE